MSNWTPPHTFGTLNPLTAPQQNTFERDNTQYIYNRLQAVNATYATFPLDMGSSSGVYQQAAWLTLNAGTWVVWGVIEYRPTDVDDRFLTRIRDATNSTTVVTFQHATLPASTEHTGGITLHKSYVLNATATLYLEGQDMDHSHCMIEAASLFALRVHLQDVFGYGTELYGPASFG